MIRTVIFDLDGTLLDTAEDISDCLKMAYSAVPEGRGIDIRQIHIGPPLFELITSLTPDISAEGKAKVIKRFRDCYDMDDYSKTKVYDGAYETLEELGKRSVRIFLATNKPIKPSLRLLEKFRMSSFFVGIITPDVLDGHRMNKKEMLSYLLEKYLLDRKETLMVGDSSSDIKAAQESKIPSVALLSGYESSEEIRSSKPDYVIEEIHDLIDLITNI